MDHHGGTIEVISLEDLSGWIDSRPA